MWSRRCMWDYFKQQFSDSLVWTDCIEQNLSRKADSSTVNNEFPTFDGIERLPVASVLRQMHPVTAVRSFFSKSCTSVFYLCFVFQSVSFFQVFQPKAYIFYGPHACHMLCLSHPRCEEYSSRNSLLGSFLYLPLTSSVLGANLLLSTWCLTCTKQ